jgi:hypothetical protein
MEMKETEIMEDSLNVICKGKANPREAWTGPEGSRRFRLPEFLENRHIKV